jgi:hypothetical protein
MLRRRMSGEPVSAPKSAGKSLGAVIEKALAYKAEDRYASVADMPVVLDLCLRELDSVPAPEGGEIFNKSESELSDVEKMMVGIISKAAEDAALTGDGGVSGEKTNKETDSGTKSPSPSPSRRRPRKRPRNPCRFRRRYRCPRPLRSRSRNPHPTRQKAPAENVPPRKTPAPAVQYGMGKKEPPRTPPKKKKKKKNGNRCSCC